VLAQVQSLNSNPRTAKKQNKTKNSGQFSSLHFSVNMFCFYNMKGSGFCLYGFLKSIFVSIYSLYKEKFKVIIPIRLILYIIYLAATVSAFNPLHAHLKQMQEVSLFYFI
jgi:hypothetical protein